jgi:hypothetical protein
MNTNIKPALNLHHHRRFYNRKLLAFITLLFAVALAFSCSLAVNNSSNNTSSFVTGTSNKIVSNETELRNAINSAKEPTTIALSNDITLTEKLDIPTNKDITLTSTSTSKFFKLIGGDIAIVVYYAPYYFPPSPVAVINVEGDATLRLDGIAVSHHAIYNWNKAVSVSASGTLILHNGEISSNSYDGNGAVTGVGVVNFGVFTMLGGTISNCGRAGVSNGGYGTFSMSGGEIFNNTGFGVYNSASYNLRISCVPLFSMSGGVIRNNDQGGVQNSGIFNLSGGEISNNVGGNIMQTGGGVQNSGNFSMSGGVISNNQAVQGGGVYNYRDGNFSLSEKGVISNNKADVGGGVYNVGTFNRRGGVISGNTAGQYNDMYPNDDSITSYTVFVVSIVLIVSVIVVACLFFISKKRNENNNC